MAKSVVGMLIGVAIQEGYIKNINQKVIDFIPEFNRPGKHFNADVSLKHLITMSAGLDWQEDYYNPFGVTAEAYFTKSEEFNDPTDPSKGKTGNIIFTLNEKWHKPEHIQNHIGKAKAAPHFPKFAEAMQYANVSVMGEIFYELKK
jgi:hypothetical protein